MSTTQPTAIARRIFEAGFGDGELAVFDELMAPDAVGHAPPAEFHGPAAFKAVVGHVREAFPELDVEVADVFGAGDGVAVRWIDGGTHEGAFQGVAPTGGAIELTGITIQRVDDGRVVEGWTTRDALGLGRQLGVEPTAGSSGPAE